MKTEKIITLDGKHNGFRAYLIEEEEFLKDEQGRLIQTKSLETLKSILYSYGYCNPYDYKVWIVDGKLEIDFDDTEYSKDHYEYFADDTQYNIKDDRTRKITSIGYYVFDNGDNILEKMATKDGEKITREYYNQVKDTLFRLVKSLESKPYIERVYRKGKTLHCTIKGSTSELCFMYNWDLVNLNVERKEKGVRCIPYLKTMDRYHTLFVYSSRNRSDYVNKEIEGMIITRILSEIIKTGQEVKYIPVEYKGVIIEEV